MMKRNRVVFEFDKDWGLIAKGTRKIFNRAHARSLQDVQKVGKMKENEDLEKLKAVKPKADKVDPGAKSKVNK